MVRLNLKIEKDFFKEEERNGYIVSNEMKKVWAVQLDLLNELLKLCKKENISIMAVGGTMLGAVRHGGFIPWDDDIDLIMSRKEYDRLCEAAKNYFKEPYFFQTEYTDKGSMRGHAQLRNSNTTAILKGEGKNVKFNQGIFIDIFPLDTVINNKKLLKKQELKVNFFKFMALKLYKFTDGYDVIEHNFKSNIIHCFAIIINKLFDYDKWYKKFEEECARYNNEESEILSALSFIFNEKRHYKYKKHYKETVDFDFEMLKIPVAKQYIEILNQQYGNWREFEIGTSFHGEVIFDTEISYKEYLKNTK